MPGARLVRSAVVALFLATLFASPPARAAADWIEVSNAHTHWLLGRQAQFNPEYIGQQGYDGVDEDITRFGPDRLTQLIAAREATVAELEQRRDAAEDPRVRQDLEIMLASVDRNLRSARLNRELTVPYVSVPRIVFFGLSGLLDPQVPAQRRAAAAVRLRRYVGAEPGYEPVTEDARGMMEDRFEVDGLVWPYRVQVEHDLQNTPRFLAGIRQLFETLGPDGYEADLATLETQFAAWDEWVRSAILPRARDDYRLPESLYALSLEQFGVRASPASLIEDATAAYAGIRNEMIALAELVAAERGWEDDDYRAVIRQLKTERFEDDNILEAYHAANDALETIIRREDIVSIPPREVSIRMKTPAEEAALPAPSLQPPRLVGNTGEVVEFLLPSPGAGDDAPDDFIFEATAWTLSAHELRPGHELQFSTMLETGVSDARATFAFNSVNVEGWALYAEAEIKPYLPLEGQLIGLQHRLMRSARAFLDPMLNTGQVSIDEARRILVEEVVLSPHMAEMEIQRYTFQMPGQATSYFYGYQLLQGLRTRTEIVLGDAFDRRAFHDFILRQGLLPPALIERAVVEEFIPSRTVLVGRNTL